MAKRTVLVVPFLTCLWGCQAIQNVGDEIGNALAGAERQPVAKTDEPKTEPDISERQAAATPAVVQSDPKQELVQWADIDIDRDRTGLTFIDLHRLMVADNIELARDHPEDFADLHYRYFVLPVQLHRGGGMPRTPDSWLEVMRSASNEFEKRDMGRRALDAIKDDLDFYQVDSRESRTITYSIRPNIREYDFESKQFPVTLGVNDNWAPDSTIILNRIGGSSQGTSSQRNLVRVVLSDGSEANIFYCNYSVLPAISFVSDSSPGILPAQFSCSIVPPEELFSITVDEQSARELRQELRGTNTTLRWHLKIRLGEIKLNRELRRNNTGKGDQRGMMVASYKQVTPIDGEILGGRMTYKNSSGAVVVLKEFGDFSTE